MISCTSCPQPNIQNSIWSNFAWKPIFLRYFLHENTGQILNWCIQSFIPFIHLLIKGLNETYSFDFIIPLSRNQMNKQYWLAKRMQTDRHDNNTLLVELWWIFSTHIHLKVSTENLECGNPSLTTWFGLTAIGGGVRAQTWVQTCAKTLHRPNDRVDFI